MDWERRRSRLWKLSELRFLRLKDDKIGKSYNLLILKILVQTIKSKNKIYG
jgi:hypothetical protein